MFNVAEFGAAADGVTDSTPGIQAAVDAAVKAGGGTVLVPSAKSPYLVRRTITINGSGVEVSGRGARLLLADGAINGQVAPVILFTGTAASPLHGVALRGLTVDANYFNQARAKNSKAVVMKFVEDSVVEDVLITRPYVGLSIRRSDRVSARRVTVTDYQEDGFDAGGDADEIPGGKCRRITFTDVVARDAPRDAWDGNAFEIEDGAEDILIQDALVENVAGNGAGLRNHKSQDNHSRGVELRNVTFRKITGFALFGRAAPRENSGTNSYREIRLVNLTADAPVLLWGPIDKLEIVGGRYTTLHLGFESPTGAATIPNALSDATIKDVEAENIRVNGASERISFTGARARSIEQVRAR
ncbi:MAG TPA: glycosyl hydrolase family 28-related protein [Candidatus Solibacter sp.]|nr:glycosyl hydrolase family 28-related protein [Candidatus Solibacter sp.]